MMETFGYIALFFVGLLLGTLGGGGSILSVPILVYLFSVDAVIASAYSLFIVGTTSLVGTVLKSNTQMVDFRAGLIFGIPSLLAIFSTRKWIVPAIPDIIVQIGEFQLSKRIFILGIFAVLMIIASFTLITRKEKFQKEKQQSSTIFMIIVGLFTGILTGLVGAGGGFLIIPALVYFSKISFKTAVGTTLFIITINSFMGFLGDIHNYQINWTFLLSITALAILGIFVGSRTTISLPTRKLRIAFGWFIMCMGTCILFREFLY